MSVQVVVATMNQHDFKLVDEMNIDSNCVIANQSDFVEYRRMKKNNNDIQLITTNTKGVSINRNIGMYYAYDDIILFADDDVLNLSNKVES